MTTRYARALSVGIASAIALSGCSGSDGALNDYTARTLDARGAKVSTLVQEFRFIDGTTMKVSGDVSAIQATTAGVNYPTAMSSDGEKIEANKGSVLIPITWTGHFVHRPTIQIDVGGKKIEVDKNATRAVVAVPAAEIGSPLIVVTLGEQHYDVNLIGQVTD